MVSLVLRFMDVFRIYDSIYIMTKGRSRNGDRSAFALYLPRQLSKYQMGKASVVLYHDDHHGYHWDYYPILQRG